MKTNDPVYWWNGYVGIPHKPHGLLRDGCSCWGLYRLVRREQFGTLLPSFAADLLASEADAVEHVMAMEGESWREVSEPEPGDLALFKVMGRWHCGMATEPGYFLHVRAGHSASIEAVADPAWQRRFKGWFRPTHGVAPGASILSMPHPLKTERLDGRVPAGLTLSEIEAWLLRESGANPATVAFAVMVVDKRPVPRDLWDVTVPKPHQIIEYRALPGDGAIRSLLQIAVIVGSALLAPVVAPALVGLGLSTAAASSIAGFALTAGGMYLVNAIAPARPPESADMTGAKRMNMLLGGSNPLPEHGSPWPLVLGRIRFTPPLATETVIEASGDEAYLRGALAIAANPVEISGLRYGDVDLNSLDNVETAILDGTDGAADRARFDALCGKTAYQEVPNQALTRYVSQITSMTRVGTTVTVVTSGDHGFSAGWLAIFARDAARYEGTITAVPTANSFTFTHASIPLDCSVVWASAWYEHVFASPVSLISVLTQFPGGLYQTAPDGDGGTERNNVVYTARVEVRPLDPGTLAPTGPYAGLKTLVPAQTVQIQSAWYNIDNDAELEPVYRWASLCIDDYGKLFVKYGAYTQTHNAEPAGLLLTRQVQAADGKPAAFTRLPVILAGETEIWRVCMLGNSVFGSLVDLRATSGLTISGGGLTMSGRTASLAAATITPLQSEEIYVGQAGNAHFKSKDPFTVNTRFGVTRGCYGVRYARTSPSVIPEQQGDQGVYTSDTATLVSFTGYDNTRPIGVPTPFAAMAFRLRATNEVTGQADGISLVAQSVCKDWDGTAWVVRPTRNPASLMRLMLQGAHLAKPAPDADLDLPSFQIFHAHCVSNGFTFDMVESGDRSQMEVIRDICAAGRASPDFSDGKWQIIIDKPRTQYDMMITPHNSWSMQFSKPMIELPHAYRVNFYNAEKGWQPDLRIVYNDGYSVDGAGATEPATVFESWNLPGVTGPQSVFKHMRFQLAQLKLRRLNITCNMARDGLMLKRGSLVAVNHDVMLWGLASGQIKTRVSGTNLILSEKVPMAADSTYEILLRTEANSYVSRTVASKPVAGYYDDITLTASVDTTEGKAGNLFAFGGAVDCIVQGLEPLDNNTVRVSLQEYAPAVYDSDSETIPAYDSGVTERPLISRNSINKAPILGAPVSDERVMLRADNGALLAQMRVPFTHPPGLPVSAQFVEGEIVAVDAVNNQWTGRQRVTRLSAAITFPDVAEGQDYQARFRYAAQNGAVGDWVFTSPHTIVGKTTKPPNVGSVTLSHSPTTGSRASWPPAGVVDYKETEIRYSDSAAGWAAATFLRNAAGTSAPIDPAPAGTTRTWYFKHRDTGGRMSAAATSVALNVTRPGNVASCTQDAKGLLNGRRELDMDWVDAVKGTLPIAGYEIRSADSGFGTAGFKYKGLTSKWSVSGGVSTTVSTNFYIRAFDTDGNYSAASLLVTHDVTPPPSMATATLTLTRQATNIVATLTNVPVRPADFDCYEFRVVQVRTGATTGDDTPDGTSAAATAAQVWADPDAKVFRTPGAVLSRALPLTTQFFPAPLLSAAGVTYRVVVAMRDKSDNYGGVLMASFLYKTS